VINGGSPIPGYAQETLISGHYKVYAAPSTLQRHEDVTPVAMLTAPLLHTDGVNSQWQAPSFHDWFEHAGLAAPATLSGMRFNLEHITAAACIQGAGYALLLDELVLDSARAGSLVAIGGPSILNPHPYTVMKKKVAKDEVNIVSEWLLNGANP
jgi:DNA-binding transcriptional LysR family regulator